MEREATASTSTSTENSPFSADRQPLGSLPASGGETSPVKLPPEGMQTERPPCPTSASGESLMRKPLYAHSRSMSLAGAGHRGKRLSLSFPVQPFGTTSSRESPSSSTSQTPMTPAFPVMVDKDTVPLSVGDSVSFLVALASHERRVLELREELGRAEGELERLKRQWALHEATKKRGEARAAEPLRPMSINLSGHVVGVLSKEEVENIELWNAEQKRRRAIVNGALANGGLKTSTSSHRKVISGQRHTRTLSLLSPDRMKYGQPFPQPANLNTELREAPLEEKPALSPSMTLPSTKLSTAPKKSSDSSQGNNDSVTRVRNSYQGPPPREALIRTGRQMAEDFKEGLWTFIEDLRQATVGDEGVNATASRTATSPGLTSTPNGAKKQGTKGNLRGNGRSPNGQIASSNNLASSSESLKGGKGSLSDARDSFWKEHGVQTPGRPTVVRQKDSSDETGLTLQLTEGLKGADDDEDSWENWDSPDTKLPPSPRWSSSTFAQSDGESPATTDGSKSRISTSLADTSATNISWPSLSDLSPGNLKRTASTLIKELERQGLAPPPLEKVVQLGLGGRPKPVSIGEERGRKAE
ncbi:MAG: hypothetical protein M1840_009102 [Geoglossum simile]|nr:MAG: hypothetical protein M1840_009102 [Geoglossum simile]